jgi:hypothetical protein
MENFFDNFDFYYGKYVEWTTSPSLLQRFFWTVMGFAAILIPCLTTLSLFRLANGFCIFILTQAPLAIKLYFQTESNFWDILIVVTILSTILIFICVIFLEQDAAGVMILGAIIIVIGVYIYYLGIWDVTAYLCSLILVLIIFQY